MCICTQDRYYTGGITLCLWNILFQSPNQYIIYTFQYIFMHIHAWFLGGNCHTNHAGVIWSPLYTISRVFWSHLYLLVYQKKKFYVLRTRDKHPGCGKPHEKWSEWNMIIKICLFHMAYNIFNKGRIVIDILWQTRFATKTIKLKMKNQ